MDFSEWNTQFEVLRLEVHERARRMRGRPVSVDPIEAHQNEQALKTARDFPTNPIVFYQMLQRRILEEVYHRKREDPDDLCDHQCIAYNQASVELEWYRHGRPYYKLYLGIVDMLVNSDINVPTKLVHAPLKAVCLRLPDNHGVAELQIEGGAGLRTILIDELEAGEHARVSDELRKNDPVHQRRFIFWFDFGEGEHAQIVAGRRLPIVAFQVLGVEDEEASFEDNLRVWMGKDRVDWERGLKISDETLVSGVRLAVGACLLATNADRVIEHDVLRRHVDKYRSAKDPSVREALFNKARRRGKYGWLLGREISLPSDYGCRETTTETGVRRELSYSHLRRGHFHTVLHGPKRSLTKIAWFHPVIVRSDLPASEASRGYKTETL